MSKKKPAPTITGETVRSKRKAMGLDQAAFWSPIGVTQSGGSRYETGRSIPRPVRKLLHLFYFAPAALGLQVKQATAGV